MPSQSLRQILTVLALLAPLASLTAQQPYKIVDHWRIGGTGGWDYLVADPANHLLYITHGPRVEVLDSTTITGMKGTHGIALDDTGKYG